MRNLVIAAAALAALAGGAHAAPPSPSPDAKAQSEGMKAFTDLKGEYDKAYRAYTDAYGAAKTDGDRGAAAALRPKPEEWSPKFKALAAKYASDPAAAECLAWIVQNDRTPATQQDALQVLLAKHLASPVVARVAQSLEYSNAPAAEPFLRAVLEKGKDHEAQGRAAYTLARMLNSHADLAARAKADKAFEGNLAQWYGKEYAESIVKGDPEKLGKEAERLFERVTKEFTDLKYGNRSLGEKAKGDLYEIRNLAIGKAAPEIVGEDENGKAIKLSDFRGKVVLLDFWGFW